MSDSIPSMSPPLITLEETDKGEEARLMHLLVSAPKYPKKLGWDSGNLKAKINLRWLIKLPSPTVNASYKPRRQKLEIGLHQIHLFLCEYLSDANGWVEQCFPSLRAWLGNGYVTITAK